VSVGYPGPVVHDQPISEPHNLGRGWVGFDFQKAFGRPVRLINDAAMQALGSYEGGRMLFLGLGTGLGSAMIVDGILEPMELAHLPYKKGRTYEDYVGLRGLKRLGEKKWNRQVVDVVEQIQSRARGRLRRPGRRQRQAAKEAPAWRQARRQQQRLPRRLPLVARESGTCWKKAQAECEAVSEIQCLVS
jgi:hypothetical protein